MPKFKDKQPGLFRWKGLVYSKFEKEIVSKDDEMKTANAVGITSGKLVAIEPDEEIEIW